MAEDLQVLNVAKWFLEKDHSKAMVEELLKCDIEIITSTEKAIKALFSNSDLTHELWLPKSVVTFKK